ncbi:MAG: sigma-54-dependent Fis family transcriptional regulator [Planctomycetes bacterium]|nr:sigma-54-dependent Fis family transcriptional regulator [Planctomycetota bacterium]
MAPARILIVDDQAAVREELAFALRYEGYEPAEASDGEAALARAGQGGIDVVLLDIKMHGMDGMQVLARLRAEHPDLPVIMISGHGDIETAVVAVKQGACDFLTKPFDTDRVLVSVKAGLRLRELAMQNSTLRRELARDHEILGVSQEIEAVRTAIERVAPTEATVLITGENGTGKELIARQLHAQSPRSQGPFFPVNCAAIPADLIESELFGHDKGAFTGATSARRGHFEQASGGTVFLDEIGDMAPSAQAKLLRALQEKVVTPVGSSRAVSVDVRVLAATNQDLQEMVQRKEFREDLYYRIHVIHIHSPALRERRADIELLARHFVQAACRRNGLSSRKLSKAAIARLREMPWPGNIRELKNCMESAAILAEGETIEVQDLAGTGSANRPRTEAAFFELQTLEEFRAATEREFIRRKIEENGGNLKRTAERIKIQRSNLYKKLERYSLR